MSKAFSALFTLYQVRHQILDSSAQKDRAALSQSKGLQNRRLPSNVAGKVPDDYSERRRANTHSGGSMNKAISRPPVQVTHTQEERDMVDGEPEMSEEERKQKVKGHTEMFGGFFPMP